MVKFTPNFTVIDFETTGLLPHQEQVIEASLIRVRHGAPVLTFNTLVALTGGRTLDPKITELTGHTSEDLRDALSEEDLAWTFGTLIDNDELIVAHNALFDMEFLYHMYKRYGITERIDYMDSLMNPFVDTLTIARAREPYPHKLTDVCRRNGLILDDAHSAEADSMSTMELVLKYHEDEDISPWVNVAGYRPKYGEPLWTPSKATIKPQGATHVGSMTKEKPKAGLAARAASSEVKTTSNRRKKVPGGEPSDLP